ncbi:MAG: hypothetical protein AABW79_01555 [Nanoarchaeota archaeon]
MGFFKRGEVVDLTEWKRRGLLEMPPEEPSLGKIDKNGMIDLTAIGASEPASNPSVSPSAESNVPSFDFLDNPSQTQSSQPIVQQSPLELNELKLKLDDTMFKLDLMLEKIKNIESRLGIG